MHMLFYLTSVQLFEVDTVVIFMIQEKKPTNPDLQSVGTCLKLTLLVSWGHVIQIQEVYIQSHCPILCSCFQLQGIFNSTE